MLKFLFIIPISLFANFNWQIDNNIDQHLKKEKLKTFEDFAFSKEYEHDTNALLIIKDKKIIYERYDNGFNEKSPLQTWSVSKSFTSALIGIAQKKGIIDINDSVKKYYPNVKSDKLKITHLLTMTSGLDWNEGYEYNPLKSNVVKMLYTLAFDDMATYTSNIDQKYEPGSRFLYSSGVTNLLSGILHKSMGKSDYSDFPWRELFDPLGITSATFQRDQSGTFVGSSYLFMSARDQARFAQLYLNKGFWNDKSLIPEDYIDKSIKASTYFNNPIASDIHNYFAYGFQWWVNKELTLDGKTSRAIPALPESAYMGLGHWGQHLVIIPEKKMIIVRAGADKKGKLQRKKFFKLLMESLK